MEKQKIHQVAGVHQINEPVIHAIDGKLDEVIALMESHTLNDHDIKYIRKRLNSILPGPELDERVLHKFEELDDKTVSRAAKADNLEQLLSGYKTDSRKIKRNNIAKGVASFTRIITSLLLIVLGFGMIIMPAPPYFEMFTLFYINHDDGVTIMDIISLIVAFAGVSLFISALVKLK